VQEHPHNLAAFTSLFIGQKMVRYGRSEEDSFPTWGTETQPWQSNIGRISHQSCVLLLSGLII